ncbi:hypothetical protein [Neisseria meningitidis]|uniref:hypothetical protein n=1 Tax=Neisseria meningitidis TaxID=487 RepID=UPI000AD4AE97|nr:hypothetical protein [Neisseria meningitidis]
MPSEAFQTAFAAFGHLKTPSFPRRRESEYIRTETCIRHSHESGNLEPLNFQTTFEYCRRPAVLDSRLRGNDEISGLQCIENDGKRWELCKKCRLKPFRRHLRRLDV